MPVEFRRREMGCVVRVIVSTIHRFSLSVAMAL
jgi:hypothetical protein